MKQNMETESLKLKIEALLNAAPIISFFHTKPTTEEINNLSNQVSQLKTSVRNRYIRWKSIRAQQHSLLNNLENRMAQLPPSADDYFTKLSNLRQTLRDKINNLTVNIDLFYNYALLLSDYNHMLSAQETNVTSKELALLKFKIEEIQQSIHNT